MLTDFLTLERPLIALDTETHAFVKPEQSHIVEIGFRILYPDGRETKRWVSYVRPPEPITEQAAAKHHITNEMVKDAPTWKELGPNIAKGFTNCDFLGYNVVFDMKVIAASMARIGVAWNYDGAYLLDGYRLWQVGAPRTLTDALREFCGREPSNAHRALEDAEDALDIVHGLLQKFTHLPRNIKELHDLAFPPPPPGALDRKGKMIWKGDDVVFTFGVHTDVPLQKVPSRYLNWMIDKGDFDEDVKRICADALAGRFPVKGVGV